MKIAQNFSTAYGGLAEHSKPALSAFSKRYNRNVQVCDDPRKGEPLIFTPSVPFLTCILTCISKKLSRKQRQLPPTFPSERIFPAKQKSPKSQARSHFSGIFVILYSVTPAYKPVPYRTAADIGFRYGQKSLLQLPHHKHDWSNCGRSAAPATLSNPLSCRKQKPA